MKTPFLFKNVNSFLSVFILSVVLLCCIQCTPPPVETPIDDSYKKKLITHEEAQVLFDEYTNTNNKILTESRNGEPDSRWYSFSIEEMEGYIKYVKEQAKEKNLKNVGIKIYLGKYPVNHPANKMAKPEFAGYQTIFLMPTAKREESQLMRRGTTSEDENIQSIQPMNMTNLSPPPNHISANSLNGN
ncbi:hypothetical protein [Chryseobacterium chendengshani]|uniref:hypothetical protein n=1 Tax=unclassified Chryseobacterium TaxID=2593645 RepID=UPI001C64072D|nr:MULTISPECIES: hypothetical protein [unclassified Chryseobacterium]MBW7675284.1 hypothetical protein [Chryseobacterium sp. LJ756]MBW8522168.1 hypothetical protein [Chryseobacterium sp. LJ668]QYK17814.1 hypothetical protein K0U91_06765 [Chryseobacterium sp. LJ668]